MSCDIIVIDSDSEDFILNFIPETPSSTEKAIPPNAESVQETPPSDDEQNNEGQPDSGN